LSGRWVDLRVQVTAAAPVECVFEVLTDWPRHSEWMPFTRAEGGQGVGAALTGWTGLGPVGFADTMVITEWVPGGRVAVRHTGRLVRGDAWFVMEPLLSGGSRIVWAEHLELPFGALGRFGWALAGPVLHCFMRVGLRRLARLAETHPSTT
jgi:Polyketide cyclase / dehydrase and lipid transport